MGAGREKKGEELDWQLNGLGAIKDKASQSKAAILCKLNTNTLSSSSSSSLHLTLLRATTHDPFILPNPKKPLLWSQLMRHRLLRRGVPHGPPPNHPRLRRHLQVPPRRSPHHQVRLLYPPRLALHVPLPAEAETTSISPISKTILPLWHGSSAPGSDGTLNTSKTSS
ncbi:hypothetical protein GBA52_026093 [Prunus armeniaca]|nr:hypothetical protein GBA52_026093 [Prunus armeniaca]